MIESFQYINKAFESKVRLGIMAVLMVNEEADFNFLKEQLSLTDGNLASHTRALEQLDKEARFIDLGKPQLLKGFNETTKGYGLGGPMLIISVLIIVFNLILTGIFVIWVEKLTRSAYNLEQAGKAKAVN